MQLHINYEGKKRIKLAALVVSAIIINVLLYFVMSNLGAPIYLDTIGTILVTIVAGPYFGIMSAVCTNTFCMLFNRDAIFFSAVNALIAVHTFSFVRKRPINKVNAIVKLVLLLAVVTGSLSTLIQWLLGDVQSTVSGKHAMGFSEATGFPFLLAALLLNITINIIDKGITTVVAIVLIQLTPETIVQSFKTSTIKQTWESLLKYQNNGKNKKGIKRSVRTRETFSLLVTSFAIVIAMSWIGLSLYYNNSKESSIEHGYTAAKFAAEIIDPTKVDEYIENGENAPGYKETEEMLARIRDNTPDVDYLYVTKVQEDGYYMVFNPYKEDEPRIEPGVLMPYTDFFIPYLPALLSGEGIDTIEYPEDGGKTLSVVYPVKDEEGNTVCYTNSDISLDYTTDYMTDFIIRVLLILAGLFILLIGYEMWMTSIYSTYPITSMTECVDRFSESGDDQQTLDENVKEIRSLGIKTGDEIEKLYHTLCDMTLNQAEQMRNIRRLSESTMKMQDGLILTMADMVESRDSDTGAHVQKTAAYVKIIVEGLKKKGYYAEKITPKFISDVVRSAPLHDVGKINISDKILNKPGKLTDEEFEIMKTHTTAGKEIIEKAISTVKGGSYLKEARNMAAYHHERWDGKGYPDGLHGEVIPLSARIMAVADVFDALTSKRVYKPAYPLEKALDILRDGAGTQFDPKCVEVFLESMPEILVILNKYNQ